MSDLDILVQEAAQNIGAGDKALSRLLADAMHRGLYMAERAHWSEEGSRPDYVSSFRHISIVQMNVNGVTEFDALVSVRGRAICNATFGFHISVDEWIVEPREGEDDGRNERP